MKKIFQHPPKDEHGKKYWRSLEEHAETPEFKEWLEREFPQGASELNDEGLSRRSFLKLMGASLALAGFGFSGCRRPEAQIVPYTKTPEWLVPGRSLQYASSMPRRRGSMPLLVTTFDGRPIKIEGNPFHPASNGKTDVFAQASILDLYDPDRSKHFLKKGSDSTSADFDAEVERLRGECQQNQGSGLAILTDETHSPTRERLRRELSQQFPKLTWATYEPLLMGYDAVATEIAYGSDVQLIPNYGKANIIFSIDADFLNADEGGLRSIADFSKGRRVEKPGDKMNRLYVVESRLTNTGGMADHRLRVPTSQMAAFVFLLAKEFVGQGVGGGLSEMVRAFGKLSISSKIDPKWIQESARDLKENIGRSLIVIGAHHHPSLQLMVYSMNQALGSFGSTLSFVRQSQAKPGSIQELAAKIQEGTISTLVILGGNPVYNAPVDFNWAKLQKSVPKVIRLGLQEDETSELSHWHVPQSHYLESWGDGLASDGSYVSIQPMILPLFGGISDLQLLAKMAGRNSQEIELIKETFGQKIGNSSFDSPDFESAWTRFIHDGFLPGSQSAIVTAPLNAQRSLDFLSKNLPVVPAIGPDQFEINFSSDLSVDDGRYINNGWMQECPDPITKLTWDNAAWISPSTAQQLGLASPVVKGRVHADVIQIELHGRQLEAPILVVPGHSDFSMTLPLGYGRARTGKVGKGSGFNAYALRTSQDLAFATGAKIKKTGRVQELAVTQDHWSMEGRALVREAPLERFNHDPHLVQKMGMDGHIPPNQSLYNNPPLNGIHQWGMAIDLNTCIGCNACVVACQSENNIPIVGKDQVLRSREMHWIRIDRYYSGDLEDPEMLMQPLPCMHCENAPCETVCPVNATVHSDEGLNVMAYNRCIGTRYCANNCPYKVRRFNFFDYNKRDPLGEKGLFGIGNLYRGPLGDKGSPDTIKMQKNPNVTVRMRGVMEKCTFCVQRLETAKIDQRVRAGASPNIKVPTDGVKTACQQVCPAEAVVFGDLTDPNSAVVKRKALPLNYRLLEYLNTQPRVSYLGKIRNPNMRMPGADQVGMSSLGDEHGEHGHSEPSSPEKVSHST